ncbi:GNAT family N-acetyltransferase [Streptomyces sp. p1417]|uniref:GNAT family N-acetyltransferase n=1 Tax=Streptomyces typhae TaxID=2681492 RepID=A0A6L6WVV1_9ACTN|nr:GNAT family N-acetyltransferase [Streptomyces typhae]MVO84101.1 GNAT family N-acetyltransferase [Streptomyces typhae]
MTVHRRSSRHVGPDGSGRHEPWTVAPEPVGSAAAVALWRAYYTEVSDRWYEVHEGRRTDAAELERGIAEDTGAGLSPPAGVLLVARHGGEPAGTVGVRLVAPGTAELTRVFVLPALRGKGGGTVLLTAAEEAAQGLGATHVRLDTRNDLVEARALYARHGYVEGPPHNSDMYAEHWFRKNLPPRTA